MAGWVLGCVGFCWAWLRGFGRVWSGSAESGWSGFGFGWFRSEFGLCGLWVTLDLAGFGETVWLGCGWIGLGLVRVWLGFGWVWSGLAEFGLCGFWVALDLAGFVWKVWLGYVGFGLVWLGLVGFGWVWLGLVDVGSCWIWLSLGWLGLVGL